ncbi:MAG: hypothetical protein KDA41_05360 [Planctomycetales bacterium]|nr:hypothetical protein [Planctomycetales bacterium]
MNQRLTTLAAWLLPVCLVLAAPAAAWACPTCKDSVNEQYAAAYGLSIVFMMSMPFVILGSLSAYFYYEVRKARRQQAAPPEASRVVAGQAAESVPSA